MYLLLSFLCGLIVSTMNIFNGQLSAHCGAYLATVIIHLIGLITFTLIMFLKKQEISFKHHLPFNWYLCCRNESLHWRSNWCTNCNF